MSRLVGPFAPIHAVRHSAAQPTSSQFIRPAPGTIPEELATGTFTRTVIWSKTPDAWLAEIFDLEGNRLGLEIAFDPQDTFLLLDGHLIPADDASA
jgi:hypothetical protein